MSSQPPIGNEVAALPVPDIGFGGDAGFAQQQGGLSGIAQEQGQGGQQQGVQGQDNGRQVQGQAFGGQIQAAGALGQQQFGGIDDESQIQQPYRSVGSQLQDCT